MLKNPVEGFSKQRLRRRRWRRRPAMIGRQTADQAGSSTSFTSRSAFQSTICSASSMCSPRLRAASTHSARQPSAGLPLIAASSSCTSRIAHRPLQIVGQHVQRYLGGDVLQRLHPEVCCHHQSLGAMRIAQRSGIGRPSSPSHASWLSLMHRMLVRGTEFRWSAKEACGQVA